jgi:chitodextrinase
MFFHKHALAAVTLVLGAAVVVSTASTTGAARRDRTPPTTPTNLRITATTDTTVTLAWNPSTDNSGNFPYRVRESGINEYAVAVPQTQTTLTFTRLWPERTYRYTVWAVDAVGQPLRR